MNLMFRMSCLCLCVLVWGLYARACVRTCVGQLLCAPGRPELSQCHLYGQLPGHLVPGGAVARSPGEAVPLRRQPQDVAMVQGQGGTGKPLEIFLGGGALGSKQDPGARSQVARALEMARRSLRFQASGPGWGTALRAGQTQEAPWDGGQARCPWRSQESEVQPPVLRPALPPLLFPDIPCLGEPHPPG